MERDFEELDGSTRKGRRQLDDVDTSRLPVLTVLAHPDMSRIGEITWLDAHLRNPISRLGPPFAAPRGGNPRPLADRYLSRQPFYVFAAGDDYVVHAEPSATPVRINTGLDPLAGARTFARTALDHGVVLELAERIVLLLHLRPPPPGVGPPPAMGLVGESAALDELRCTIARVAEVAAPVLLRGETGSGKELVAQALHICSPRSKGPLIALNLAAIPAGTAASELFGHARGAFSGADRDWEGRFVQAHGGTLFLDEIAEASIDLQVMLLRALETSEIMPVGGGRIRRVSVRLVAATDADIERALDSGRIRAPLYHRLAGYPIDVPPLRVRRDDVGRLLRHFLVEELRCIGEPERLEIRRGNDTPWLPARLVTRLTCHDWPGNVRELRNVARRIVIAGRGCAVAPTDLKLGPERGVVNAGEAALDAASARKVRQPGPCPIDDGTLIEVLRTNAFQLTATAKVLGISRTTLDALIARSARIRKARDITAAELQRALAVSGGDANAAAALLEISVRALKLRMREIGGRP